jgi:hypothetical protein
MTSYTVVKYSLYEKRIKTLVLKNKNYIVFFKDNHTYYFWVTPYLFIKKIKSHLFFVSEGSSPSFYLKSMKNLILWNKRVQKPVIKRIILKGLGLKAFFVKDLNLLQLKLGFSQIITIPVPIKKISLVLSKRRIIVVGHNILEVSKFAFKIKLLKLPNIYKGKGLWYKNEKINLKPVRKT